MTWAASISGRPIELLHPRVDEVDFKDLADALAHLNRYAGNAQTPVSVGMHLIIGCDIAPAPLRPWWLAHDLHEPRTSEVTSPAKETLSAIAFEMYGRSGAEIVERTRKEFERRHDEVIHAAAGLAMPTEAQKREIKRIDLIALATEKRDFHSPDQRRPWFTDLQDIEPFRRKEYRWKPPIDVAGELLRRFRLYFPSVNARRVA